MSWKQFFTLIVIFALFALAFTSAVPQFMSIGMKDLLGRVFILGLYFLLAMIYLLRFVLPVIGVLVIYKTLRDRANLETV